jgi:hypothetical protein
LFAMVIDEVGAPFNLLVIRLKDKLLFLFTN